MQIAPRRVKISSRRQTASDVAIGADIARLLFGPAVATAEASRTQNHSAVAVG
jgi:hypothetical protein